MVQLEGVLVANYSYVWLCAVTSLVFASVASEGMFGTEGLNGLMV